MTILVTGGAGFIGSNFVIDCINKHNLAIVNVDKLTYAGNPHSLSAIEQAPSYRFIQGDICDQHLIAQLLNDHQPRAIINFAAESHVDRSIHGPGDFIQTNIFGTFSLLQAARAYWQELSGAAREHFRFLHVSTDEVYGSLEAHDPAFTETTAYAPNSPYSASKAASDHLVRAWHHTYGLPVLTTNCSNNYGPYQFPEKLIPLMIMNALAGKALPIYGDGLNVRDWLYVTDHCDAILHVLDKGRVGEIYNIGGNHEKTNIEIVRTICGMLDEMQPDPAGSYERLITYVSDRPGHDRRYAIDARKINAELDWEPQETFDSGIRKTIAWYLENRSWTDKIQSGAYREWLNKNYGQRTPAQ